MVTISDATRDILNVVAGILWVYLAIALWTADYHPLLCCSSFVTALLIIVIYFVLGASSRGMLGIVVPLLYPITCMSALWLVAYIVAYLTRGQEFPFVLGMHPGWLASVLFFWIGTLLTSTLGYYLHFSKCVLTDEQWDDFLTEISKMKDPK